VTTTTLSALEAALRRSWSLETCAPEDRPQWSPANPARGQCGVTALVLHDHLGGELVLGEVHVDGVRVDHHWWNALPGGEQVDLTHEQFAPHEVVVGGRVLARPPHLTRLHEEYALLRDRVRAVLSADAAAGR
jgi:hypothetical protein